MTLIFFLLKRSLFNGNVLKVEFTYYPLKNLEDIILIGNLRVDSLLDIIINKLCAIADRSDVKDYVDIYWALQRGGFSLKELMNLAEKKCETRGVTYILRSRLLQIPDGIENIPLKVEIKKTDIKALFERQLRDIILKEL